MKKLITLSFATMVAFSAYSQDGVHLPLTGGALSGPLTVNNSSFFNDVIYAYRPASDVVLEGGAIYMPGGYTSLRVGIDRSLNVDNYNGNSRVNALKIMQNGDAVFAGVLTGASAIFTNNLNTNGTLQLGGWNTISYSDNTLNVGGVVAGQWSKLRFFTNDILRYDIDDGGNHNFKTGTATFGGSLSGTSATFSGNVTPIINLGSSLGSSVVRWDAMYAKDINLTESAAISGNVLIGGTVSIGTTDSQGYKLAVAGKIRAAEIKVEALPWPDYVFHPSYKLPDLKSTEQFIKENKHLPEIPSAAEVAKEGINLGEMNAKLLQKIEELTLYMIEQNKRSLVEKTE